MAPFYTFVAGKESWKPKMPLWSAKYFGSASRYWDYWRMWFCRYGGHWQLPFQLHLPVGGLLIGAIGFNGWHSSISPNYAVGCILSSLRG
jgi:hypothetical protein